MRPGAKSGCTKGMGTMIALWSIAGCLHALACHRAAMGRGVGAMWTGNGAIPHQQGVARQGYVQPGGDHMVEGNSGDSTVATWLGARWRKVEPEPCKTQQMRNGHGFRCLAPTVAVSATRMTIQ